MKRLKKYITDSKSRIFIHPVVEWKEIDGQMYPLISDGEKLVFPREHEVYKGGYEIVDDVFDYNWLDDVID